jgi:hypothetical protein
VLCIKNKEHQCPQYICTETQFNNTTKNYLKFNLNLKHKKKMDAKCKKVKTPICCTSLQFNITLVLTQRCSANIAFAKIPTILIIILLPEDDSFLLKLVA